MFASKTGTPLDYAGVHRRVLAPARKAAGIPAAEVGALHAFRHTCASMLFHSGRNIRQVSDWLGHHDPAFTMRVYVGTLDEGVGSANVLDEIMPLGEWATDGQPAPRN